MQTWWLIGVGGGVLVAITFGLFWPRRPRTQDLGVISSQWIAQHRSSTHDPDR
jgi:hypothetical protein